MSLNDLFNSDIFIPTILVVFVLTMIIGIPLGLSVARKNNAQIYGDDDSSEPVKSEHNVRVIAHRNTPHPNNNNVIINKLVFQFENGQRVELAIKDKTLFATTVDGDVGTLSYQGKKFIDFVRVI